MSFLGELLGGGGGAVLGNLLLPGVGGLAGGFLGNKLAGGSDLSALLAGGLGYTLPGDPMSLGKALYGGFSGDLSWNPFSSGNSVWDEIGMGDLSKNDKLRPIGRMVGAMIGGGFAGGAMGVGEGAAGAAGAGEGAAGAGAASSFADQGIGYAGLDAAGASALGSEGYSAGLSGLGSFANQGIGYAGLDSFGAQSLGSGPIAPGGGGWMDMFGGWGNNSKDWMNKILKMTGGWRNLSRMGLGLYGLNRMQAAKRAANAPIDVNSSPEYKAALDAANRRSIASGGFGSGQMAAAAASVGPQIYNQIWQRQQAQAGAGGNADLGSILMLASMMGN